MSDYRVSIRFRNARLLRAIESAGYKPGQKFSEIIGVSYASLLGYLNLTRAPFLENGDLRPCAEKICVFLNKMPCDLWSEEQRIPLEKNKSETELTGYQVARLFSLCSENDFDPLENLERAEGMSLIEDALKSLTPREEEVMRARFGIDGEAFTLDEVAKQQGVTRERIRQIETKALRRLRNPENVIRKAAEMFGLSK